MNAIVLTPFSRGQARRIGQRLWRKMLLPVGEIRYQDRTLKFTREYLQQLASSFRDRAYDQVALQLAPGDNSHSNDPERFRGEVTDMTVESDGLWVTVQPTERGDQILSENPKLGVSARIVESYDRADGKFFPAAVQHVLATLDPRIPGMGGWAAVEASNSAGTVVLDLSGASFAGKDGDMPDLDAAQQAKLARLLEIPDDKLSQLIEGLNVPEITDEELDALLAEDGQGADELTDEELNALLEAAAEMEAAGLLEPEPVAAGLSRDPAQDMAIELARAQADENRRQLQVISDELDEQRYATERRRLADSGVPPFITDLARPLLLGSGHVVEMSNGQGVDAGQVMRKVLTEFGRLAGALDLSVELGTPADEPVRSAASADARAELVSRFRSTVGI